MKRGLRARLGRARRRWWRSPQAVAPYRPALFVSAPTKRRWTAGPSRRPGRW